MIVQRVPPEAMFQPMEIGVYPAAVTVNPYELKLIKENSELVKGVFEQLMITYEADVGQYASYVPELGKI